MTRKQRTIQRITQGGRRVRLALVNNAPTVVEAVVALLAAVEAHQAAEVDSKEISSRAKKADSVPAAARKHQHTHQGCARTGALRFLLG